MSTRRKARRTTLASRGSRAERDFRDRQAVHEEHVQGRRLPRLNSTGTFAHRSRLHEPVSGDLKWPETFFLWLLSIPLPDHPHLLFGVEQGTSHGIRFPRSARPAIAGNQQS